MNLRLSSSSYSEARASYAWMTFGSTVELLPPASLNCKCSTGQQTRHPSQCYRWTHACSSSITITAKTTTTIGLHAWAISTVSVVGSGLGSCSCCHSESGGCRGWPRIFRHFGAVHCVDLNSKDFGPDIESHQLKKT